MTPTNEPWWTHAVNANSELRLDSTLQHLEGPDGHPVLLGGSPLRLLRLRSPADEVVRALRNGASVESTLLSLVPERRAGGRRFLATLVQRGLAHPVPRPDPARGLTDVTIVIPVHNRPESLSRLLAALEPSVARGAQVFVVDDGSTDATGSVALGRGARVVRRLVRGGPSAARNAGLACVETAFVAFLDSDTVPCDGWLETCLSHLDGTTGVEGLGPVDLVAPRIVSRATKSDEGSRLAELITEYERVRSPLDLGSDPALVAPMTRVAYTPAAALVGRTVVLREVGGFDESLTVGEDVDLLWRLVADGMVVRYEPLAEVAHDHRSNPGAFVRRRFHYGTSAALLDRRHRGLVPPAVLSPWSAVAMASTAFGLPGVLAAMALAGATATRLPAKLPQLLPTDGRRLAWRGHVAAAEQVAVATTRTWFPAAVILALVNRRMRWFALAGAVIPGLREYHRRRPVLGRLPFLMIRAVDDAAYGCGVWVGSLRERSIGALLPKIQNWPGRRSVSEDTKR